MKVIVVIAVVVFIVIVLMLVRAFTQRGDKPSMSVGTQRSVIAPKTLEEKLAVLERCGITLAPPFTVDDLLELMDRSSYEEAGWDIVLVGLGSENEEEPNRFFSDNIWYFDTECIEDHGDYKHIAERMAKMTQGSLPLADIKDYVDIENNQAWVSLKLNGKEIKIDCKVEDDWVDDRVFSEFVELLEKNDPSKVYIYYDLGGQDCIIGCVTKTQLSQLQSAGIQFESLAET